MDDDQQSGRIYLQSTSRPHSHSHGNARKRGRQLLYQCWDQLKESFISNELQTTIVIDKIGTVFINNSLSDHHSVLIIYIISWSGGEEEQHQSNRDSYYYQQQWLASGHTHFHWGTTTFPPNEQNISFHGTIPDKTPYIVFKYLDNSGHCL